ncbi:MAG: ATP-binding cassette domain-containing protein [Candidatus Diapherotrites archaeon]
MPANAIETEKICKSYGSLKAVDNVTLSVKQGSIFGLLGPNGAGKTTLISMLVTMRKPTSGSAKVNGFDVSSQAGMVRKSIGIVFQDPSLDDELTARENLEMHASLYGVPKEKRAERAAEVVKIVGLEGKMDIVVKKFSGGMKRRLEIARGLIHHPKVLFLDEPTLGLDPQTRAGIWKYIKEINKAEGITIILTTHYMDEADGVCGRIAIIDNGKIMAMDTPANLKNALGGDIISVKCGGGEECAEKLRAVKWAKKVTAHDGFMDVTVEKGEEKIPELMRLAEKSGTKVGSVSLRKPSLDDVFLHYTDRTIREEEAKPIEGMRMRGRAWGRGG